MQRMCHTLACLHSGSSPCTPPLPATFQTWTAAGHLGAKESSLTGDVTIRLKNVPYPCSRDKSPHRPWLVCLREHFYIRNPPLMLLRFQTRIAVRYFRVGWMGTHFLTGLPDHFPTVSRVARFAFLRSLRVVSIFYIRNPTLMLLRFQTRIAARYFRVGWMGTHFLTGLPDPRFYGPLGHYHVFRREFKSVYQTSKTSFL